MTQEIEIFGFGNRDRSSKVRWVAHELGLEVRDHRIKPGDQISEEYRELNPVGVIPSVIFRGQVLVESTAICHFLAETFPESRLTVAPDEAERYDFLRWTSLFTETFELRIVDYMLSRIGYYPEADYGTAQKRILEKRLPELLALMPSSGYLVADRFTIADVIAAFNFKTAIAAGLMSVNDVRTYLQPLAERPAARNSRFFEGLSWE